MPQIQLPEVGADPRDIFPASADDARRILTEGRPALVYFTKSDGSTRRMLCNFTGCTSRTADTLVVFDCEKGALRTIRLDRVHSIRVLSAPERPTRPSVAPSVPQRPTASHAGQKSPRLQAMIDELADFC